MPAAAQCHRMRVKLHRTLHAIKSGVGFWAGFKRVIPICAILWAKGLQINQRRTAVTNALGNLPLRSMCGISHSATIVRYRVARGKAQGRTRTLRFPNHQLLRPGFTGNSQPRQMWGITVKTNGIQRRLAAAPTFDQSVLVRSVRCWCSKDRTSVP